MLNDLLILGFAAATVSITVGQSSLFEPVRSAVSRSWPWGGKLVSCPYCLGHWVSAAVVIYYASGVEIDRGFIVVLWLAVTAVSALVTGIVGRLYA